MKYGKLISVSVLLAALIFLATLAYFYPSSFGFLSIFVKDALWASVLVTVVLVVINAVYTMQTRQSIKEMEKARKADFCPHVRADLSFLGPFFLILKATNFGKGPAINVRVKITFLPSNAEKIWTQAAMSPNEFISILLPNGDLGKVLDKSAEIVVKGDYKDIFGQVFPIDEKMDVKAFIDEARELEPILEKDLAGLVEGIKKELEQIGHGLREIAGQLGRRKE